MFLVVAIYNEKPDFEHFVVSILITVVAALVENLCEPYYVAMLLKMEFSQRAKAEGMAIFVKSVLIYFLIFKGMGLLAYAIA